MHQAIGVAPKQLFGLRRERLARDVAQKAGELDQAIAQLLHALACTADPEQRAAVHFRLAKLYEHEQGDLARALQHARGTEPAEGPELHGRRLGRLYRRLLRQPEVSSRSV